MARLKVKYTEEIAPALMKKFQYKSVMQIPQIAKVIVNVCLLYTSDAADEQEQREGDRGYLQGYRHHHRPEAHHDEGSQVRRKLQGP